MEPADGRNMTNNPAVSSCSSRQVILHDSSLHRSPDVKLTGVTLSPSAGNTVVPIETKEMQTQAKDCDRKLTTASQCASQDYSTKDNIHSHVSPLGTEIVCGHGGSINFSRDPVVSSSTRERSDLCISSVSYKGLEHVSSNPYTVERVLSSVTKSGPADVSMCSDYNGMCCNTSGGSPIPVTRDNTLFGLNNADDKTCNHHESITSAGIKKEANVMMDNDQTIHNNWERQMLNGAESLSIKVENETSLDSKASTQTLHQNHIEKIVGNSETSVTLESKKSVVSIVSDSSSLSQSAQTTDKTSGSNNLSNSNLTLNSASITIQRTTRRTRSSSQPFVVMPSIDSSDSEQEVEQNTSLSSSSPSQTSVKFIKQEPQQSNTSETGPVRSSLRQTRRSAEIANVEKKRSGRQKKPLKQTQAKIVKKANLTAKPKGTGKAEKKQSSKTCHICEKTFTRPESLTVHMRVHTGDRPYQCELCDANYKIAGHLRDHVRSKHSSARPYLCTKCGKDFSYSTARRRHEKSCGKNLSERIEFKCPTCDKGFVTAKGFAKHQNTCGSSTQRDNPEKELPFKCGTCDKSFATSPGLERHQRFICGKVPPRGLYTCEECGKTYAKRDRFYAHMRRHRGEKPFKCSLCDSEFYDQGALKKHVNRHEENRKFRCSMCEAAFYEKQALSVHVMRIHCGLKPFKCNECDADLSSAYQLSKHIRNLHRLERPFKCMLCGKEFFDAKPYKKHMHQHTVQLTNPNQRGPLRPKQHTCNLCNRAFFWRGLSAHVASEHPGLSLSDVLSKEVLKCDLCGKEFSCQQTLCVHKRGHTSTKRFKCDKCDRQFAVLSALRFHSSKHSEDRPHCCQDCGKAFRWLSNLSYHRMTHHTPKPDFSEVHIENYVCNECGRDFKRENFLYLHLKLKRHGQATPCICSQCGRGYTDINEYKNHMSTHDKVTAKPYVCSICGAGFFYQHILDRHHRQRHAQLSKSSWLCEECGKYFTRKVYLQKHMARHAKYPQGQIPPAGRPKKDSRSPDPQGYLTQLIPDTDSQNCAVQTPVDSGLVPSTVMPPSESHSDNPEGPAQSGEELNSISLFELQNYQSHYSTFIHQTLAWPKPDDP